MRRIKTIPMEGSHDWSFDIGTACFLGTLFEKDAKNSNPFKPILMFDAVMNINVDLRILLKIASSKINFV
jgi:hypothetical protein